MATEPKIFHGDHRDADGDRAGLDDRTREAGDTILGLNAMGLPPGSVVDSRDPRLQQGNLPADPEPRGVTVWCSECGEAVVIRDVHAYVLGLHQRVCRELERVNGVDA